jgi:hypothetical protein
MDFEEDEAKPLVKRLWMQVSILRHGRCLFVGESERVTGNLLKGMKQRILSLPQK